MELILHNGKIKAETGDVSAVFCRDGVFEAVGSDEEVLALKTEQTKVIDLQGKRVLPGFDDSHMHFLDIGYSFRKLDLRPAKSVEDVIEKFQREAGWKPTTGIRRAGRKSGCLPNRTWIR